MQKLFGIPVGELAVVLAAATGVVLAVIAALAVRNRVVFRLGVRNLPKRRGRTLLIVAGLMLATAIVSSALATGDTMSHTIRSTALDALGHTDELISVEGGESQGYVGIGYFPESDFAEVARLAAREPLIDGVAPAIFEPVALQDLTSRQTEPNVALFATDPAHFGGFGEIRNVAGGTVSLAELGRDEIFLNDQAADELSARPGDRLRLFAAGRPASFTVRAVVHYDGTGGFDVTQLAVLLPLARAQELLGRQGEIKHVLVSNRGDTVGGARHSQQVMTALEPGLAPLGLEISHVKQDALDFADELGTAFMSFFTIFGTFSIAAGIMLVFLIFVMLAAERRAELGIARAIGTRRGHLVQMFVFEGVAYDLVAAAVGALLGVGIAFGMVLVMARALGEFGLDVRQHVTGTSIVIAYCLGVLLTFLVVTFSAWRVSVLNIVAAIRNLPTPRQPRRRRRIAAGLLAVALGVLLTLAGLSGEQLTALLLGISLVILGLVPVARGLGVPERAAFGVAGLLVVVLWLLPMDVFGDEFRRDMSLWIVGGITVVIAATWLFIYNADLVLRAVSALVGRAPGLAPVTKLAAAYPLRNRFRTGTTFAMFTLVVFVLVVGVTNSSAFMSAFDDVDQFGGGFDVQVTTPVVSAVDDFASTVRTLPGVDGAAITAVSSSSAVFADARQGDTERDFEIYPVHGVDDVFLERTTYGLAATAHGYGSAREVWDAVRTHPGLAVVDALAVPRRDNWGSFGSGYDFRLSGFRLEDGTFEPVPVEVRDLQTGKSIRLTVIGVLEETAPDTMLGLTTSQAVLAPFGERARPTLHLLSLAAGTDPDAFASTLESALLANGAEADSMRKLLDDTIGVSRMFNRLLEGFIGLGLIVGVAALGVISARSVVERRQQIGVLRSIGFQQRMIQAGFLLESSFIALGSIVVGTGLGLVVAYNVVDYSRRQPSWENMSFAVPWAALAVIFVIVYLATLLTTLLPARRAARVFPAEALRYQ